MLDTDYAERYNYKLIIMVLWMITQL